MNIKSVCLSVCLKNKPGHKYLSTRASSVYFYFVFVSTAAVWNDNERAPFLREGGRGLLEDEDTDTNGRKFRGPGGHHHHHHKQHHHPVIETPFKQDLKNWGTGPRCYQSCRKTCEDYFDYNIKYEPGYKTHDSSHYGSEKRVQCKVAYADVVQYCGAAGTEVTGGPKLLRHIKSGRCDAEGPDTTMGLPAPISQSVKDMMDDTPIFSTCHCGSAKHLVRRRRKPNSFDPRLCEKAPDFKLQSNT